MKLQTRKQFFSNHRPKRLSRNANELWEQIIPKHLRLGITTLITFSNVSAATITPETTKVRVRTSNPPA